jgi:hypothetical protein
VGKETERQSATELKLTLIRSLEGTNYLAFGETRKPYPGYHQSGPTEASYSTREMAQSRRHREIGVIYPEL